MPLPPPEGSYRLGFVCARFSKPKGQRYEDHNPLCCVAVRRLRSTARRQRAANARRLRVTSHRRDQGRSARRRRAVLGKAILQPNHHRQRHARAGGLQKRRARRCRQLLHVLRQRKAYSHSTLKPRKADAPPLALDFEAQVTIAV